MLALVALFAIPASTHVMHDMLYLQYKAMQDTPAAVTGCQKIMYTYMIQCPIVADDDCIFSDHQDTLGLALNIGGLARYDEAMPSGMF
eukprot:scaffold266712_cov19-Prasinocladus_malaysianus.AAC.1